MTSRERYGDSSTNYVFNNFFKLTAKNQSFVIQAFCEGNNRSIPLTSASIGPFYQHDLTIENNRSIPLTSASIGSFYQHDLTIENNRSIALTSASIGLLYQHG